MQLPFLRFVLAALMNGSQLLHCGLIHPPPFDDAAEQQTCSACNDRSRPAAVIPAVTANSSTM
eukprot:8345237-Prorocentrum_lima.AAC.1